MLKFYLYRSISLWQYLKKKKKEGLLEYYDPYGYLLGSVLS